MLEFRFFLICIKCKYFLIIVFIIIFLKKVKVNLIYVIYYFLFLVWYVLYILWKVKWWFKILKLNLFLIWFLIFGNKFLLILFIWLYFIYIKWWWKCFVFFFFKLKWVMLLLKLILLIIFSLVNNFNVLYIVVKLILGVLFFIFRYMFLVFRWFFLFLIRILIVVLCCGVSLYDDCCNCCLMWFNCFFNDVYFFINN